MAAGMYGSAAVTLWRRKHIISPRPIPEPCLAPSHVMHEIREASAHVFEQLLGGYGMVAIKLLCSALAWNCVCGTTAEITRSGVKSQ
jgi:hypothetical protein